MVLKKIFGRKSVDAAEESGEIDIENYLSDLSIREGKIIEREDVTYVKPVDLDSEGKGVGPVIKELEKGNIVVLNVRELLSNKILLRNVVKELRETCSELNGDIGRISPEKILLVPDGMRIIHRISGGSPESREY
ncbi:MAG: cell division protein SepF [Candidatus Altiarchaeota archaeon]|nr:cell division protein SepF [Candidatus Altiarchaeota archaeon]